MKCNIKTPLFIIKWTHFEYWPFWLLYAPMVLYGLLLALRARSLTYFTATNPSMKYGGAFDMEKTIILGQLDPIFVPQSLLIQRSTPFNEVIQKINKTTLSFPLIAKPNIGERGINVEKIHSFSDLEYYLNNQYYDTLIQEFIDYPLELGIFYYRYPDGSKDGISSVVIKELLTITGNGKDTLGQLLEKKTRARFRLKYLQKKYHSSWNKILSNGFKKCIEPIGNHNRGTKFMDGNHLINEQLISVFRQLSTSLPGYYYGRFDLKTRSTQDLYAGQHIKILELNGVNSEPAHIYDPHMNLIKAYAQIIKHMHIVLLISMQNMRGGTKTTPVIPFIKALHHHLFPKSQKPHKLPKHLQKKTDTSFSKNPN